MTAGFISCVARLSPSAGLISALSTTGPGKSCPKIWSYSGFIMPKIIARFEV